MGPVIGAVRVNVPFTFHKNDYECAAWWEDHGAVTGVYPVTFEKEYHSPHDIYACGQIGALVTDDYFQSLWCGMPIGKEAYRAKHIGENRIIRQRIDLVEAIRSTGHTPDGALSWYIHRPWWDVALRYAEKKLVEAYERLPEFWEKYRAGEDEYFSRVGMIGHFGSILTRRSREIQEIKTAIRHSQSDTFIPLHHQNTEWVRSSGIVMEIPHQNS